MKIRYSYVAFRCFFASDIIVVVTNVFKMVVFYSENFFLLVKIIMMMLGQFTPQRPGTRPVSDAERIHAEVEDQLTTCQCHSQFAMLRVDDGKYKVATVLTQRFSFLAITKKINKYVSKFIEHMISKRIAANVRCQ